MSNFSVKTEHAGLDKLLETLDDEQYRKKVMLKGLEAGGAVLRDATKDTMRSLWPAASHVSRYTNAPIYEGVNIQRDKAYNEVQVDILKRSVVDWRVRFFESQIRERVTSKGQRRGTVKPYHFFRTARTNAQDEINYAISHVIDLELRKLL